MNHFNPCELNLENQRLIQILIDKLVFLASSNNYTNEVDLLTEACLQTDINMVTVFCEDISNIFMYSCQIILNQNMCIVSGSGISKGESLKMAVGKFLQYLFNQRNQTFPIEDSRNLFVKDIVDGIKTIDIVDNFTELCKAFFLTQMMKPEHFEFNCVNNYESLKSELSHITDPILILSESFHPQDINVICTIFLNGSLVLQQEVGENQEAALEKATGEMFLSYAMIPDIQNMNGFATYSDNEKVIIQNMAKKFEETKINSENHWITIQKCAIDLNYQLQLKYHNKVCSVMVNDVEILKAFGDTEYCAQIQACKNLLKLFSKELSRRYSCTANGSRNSEENLRKIIEAHIKNIVLRIHPLIESGESKPVWPILNEELLKEGIKFELEYVHVNNVITCTYIYRCVKIICGEAVNRNTSREEAAKNLINKFRGV